MKFTDKNTPQCETCIKGKMTQTFNKAADPKASKPIELVHTDLASPITPATREGFEYAITFVDDYSGCIGVYFLKNKSIYLIVHHMGMFSVYAVIMGANTCHTTTKNSLLITKLNIKLVHRIRHTKMVLLSDLGAHFLIWVGAL